MCLKKNFFIDHSTGHAAFSYFQDAKRKFTSFNFRRIWRLRELYYFLKFTVTKGTLTYKKFVSGGNFIIGDCIDILH